MNRRTCAVALAFCFGVSACGDAGDLAADGSGSSTRLADGDRSRLDLPITPPAPGDGVAAAVKVEEARREWSLGHPEQVKQRLLEALALDPANLEALLLRGAVGLAKSFAYDPLHALAAFRTALLVDPANGTARVGEALARVELADDLAAEQLLQVIVEDDGSARVKLDDDQRASVQRALAQLHLRAGRFEPALLASERALQLRANDRASRALRAEILERLDRPAEAAADLEVAISMRPDEASLHFAYARVLRRLERPDDAARQTRIHRALQPFEEDASEAFKTDWTRRIELRRELVAAFPEFRRARHLLVRELLSGRQLVEAQTELDALVAADSADAEAWFLLAKLRVQQGDAVAARMAADRMLATGRVKQLMYDDLLREISGAADGGR